MGLTMIAAFLKNADGNFDIPALAMSIFLAVMAGGLLLYLPKTLRSGRIHFEWTPRTARTIKRDFEREKNPAIFWFLFILYCFCFLLFVTGVAVISFGLLRNSN